MTMSIKRILAFVLLAILVYGGCYIAVFGVRQYFQYSGAERTYNNLPHGQYQNLLNVKGSIDSTKKVTQLIFTEPVRKEILGFPIGKQLERKYYILLLNPSEDKEFSRYCVIAATEPEDIKQLEALKDGGSAEYEFRGLICDMPYTIHSILTDRLQEIYDTDFNIYIHKKSGKVHCSVHHLHKERRGRQSFAANHRGRSGGAYRRGGVSSACDKHLQKKPQVLRRKQ